jgi:hypothetical protein
MYDVIRQQLGVINNHANREKISFPVISISEHLLELASMIVNGIATVVKIAHDVHGLVKVPWIA